MERQDSSDGRTQTVGFWRIARVRADIRPRQGWKGLLRITNATITRKVAVAVLPEERPTAHCVSKDHLKADTGNMRHSIAPFSILALQRGLLHCSRFDETNPCMRL